MTDDGARRGSLQRSAHSHDDRHLVSVANLPLVAIEEEQPPDLVVALGPASACPHVSGGCAFVCVDHPRAGFLCDECRDHHLLRDDPAQGRCCDRCGDVGVPLHGLLRRYLVRPPCDAWDPAGALHRVEALLARCATVCCHCHDQMGAAGEVLAVPGGPGPPRHAVGARPLTGRAPIQHLPAPGPGDSANQPLDEERSNPRVAPVSDRDDAAEYLVIDTGSPVTPAEITLRVRYGDGLVDRALRRRVTTTKRGWRVEGIPGLGDRYPAYYPRQTGPMRWYCPCSVGRRGRVCSHELAVVLMLASEGKLD